MILTVKEVEEKKEVDEKSETEEQPKQAKPQSQPRVIYNLQSHALKLMKGKVHFSWYILLLNEKLCLLNRR